MSAAVEQLGEVTLPSGTLVILDCGLLGGWSHDRPPLMPEGLLAPDLLESVNAGTDFQLVGADAAQAGRALRSQGHPHFVYDVPRHEVGKLTARFEEVIQGTGLRAELRPLPERVPHRTRVDQATSFGGGAGEVFFYGITAAAVEGLPRDRWLGHIGRFRQLLGDEEAREIVAEDLCAWALGEADRLAARVEERARG